MRAPPARVGEAWRAAKIPLTAGGDGRRVATEPMPVVLFVPDITDVSTIKRVEAFAENGVAPTVFGFRRARYNRDFQPTWPYVELGRTADRKYFHRVLALFAALRHLLGNKAIFAKARLFYARNIDQLLLALFARWWFQPKAEIVYEDRKSVV